MNSKRSRSIFVTIAIILTFSITACEGITSEQPTDRLPTESIIVKSKPEDTVDNASGDSSGKESSTESTETNTVEVDSIISFGGFDWKVLDVQDGKALILSETILETMPWHFDDNFPTTWEESDMRYHLNNNFYDVFSSTDQERIIEVKNTNPDNPWYGSYGGNDTYDKIFLLSIEEVVKYFGDSGQLGNKPSGNVYIIRDWYDGKRVANNTIDKPSSWWLRTPGSSDFNGNNVEYNCASRILEDGGIDVFGPPITWSDISVRPAMWITI